MRNENKRRNRPNNARKISLWFGTKRESLLNQSNLSGRIMLKAVKG